MFLKTRTFFLIGVSSLLLGCTFSNGISPGYKKITNDIFWDTSDGQPIYSQGGGVFRLADPQTGQEKYYWYGVHYQEAELYRNDPVKEYDRCTFVSVTCYSSEDLVNWQFEGDVLTRQEAERNGHIGWMGRMGVARLPESGQYALFIQFNGNVMIAVSDSPVKEFTTHRLLNMEQWIGSSGTGDQTVFSDPDTGKSYLVYSRPNGRNRIFISEIGINENGVDLLDCTEIYKGEGREGNCMFKYNGKYYMCASNLYGWDSSFAYYLVSDDVRGPFTPTNQMLVMPGCEEDFAHITQTGFFITVQGTEQETVIYCGDRWADFAANGWGYNQWFPLSFDGDVPHFNSLNSWYLDEETGRWKVAEDNNYVKNGSFEADRRLIPNPVKPPQDYLLGWNTEIIKGNRVLLNDSLSPVLNRFNSEPDRRTVIGEKSMQISDIVDFTRKVSQVISSSAHVELPDGYYSLSAMLKNSDGFGTLSMYALSHGEKYETFVEQENPGWTEIRIDQLYISEGRVEIGFYAEGQANANVCIDDVVLRRKH